MMFRILAVATFLSSCILVVILTTTNPSTAGLGGMLAVFILGYLSLLGVVTFLLYYGSRFWRFLTTSFGVRVRPTAIALGRAYLFASVLSLLPMIAVGLYSSGGIRWYELVLLGLFGVIGMVYAARRA